MNTMKTSTMSMEDLNAALKQDADAKQMIQQEIYWENMMNQEHQVANEGQSEKPTLLEIMEKFRGKNLFPEAVERTKTYLERIKESESIILNEMQSNKYCYEHHLKVDQDGLCPICREQSNK